MSKLVTYYNNSTQRMDKKCELTKGEQYDLAVRNKKSLHEQIHDELVHDKIKRELADTLTVSQLTFD